MDGEQLLPSFISNSPNSSGNQRTIWKGLHFMAATKASLIIPLENQVRELDAKILLSCVAAQRGFSCIIGSRRELDFHVASFPRSLYLAKSMAASHVKMFRIIKDVGHEIAAWDEEALVHMQPETYYSRRLSPVAITYVSHLFAWGEENADLLRQYPDLPEGIPIYVTGNPRGDLLRPEMRGYFARDAEDLRKAYGDFILINTNFGEVNAFYPSENLFLPPVKPGEEPTFGPTAVGMSRKFAEGLRDYKQAIFDDFKRLLPALKKAFPDYTIVVRPHPSENPQVYREIASRCERVRVINEGNVIPWLRAAKALVHNGCTTAIEAYLMSVPAVSYQATVNEYYDRGFYRLPHSLSHQCFNCDDLLITLRKILSGELGPPKGEERRALMGHYLTAQDGPLACQRIADVLENIVNDHSKSVGPTLPSRLHGRYLTTKRRIRQKFKIFKSYLPYLPKSKYRAEFQRHRYPGVSLPEMREKVARFQDLLGKDGRLHVEQHSRYIFKISE
jgi:surface carbohydrate biosynthesis protein